jgi:hypothetical protein
MVYFDQMYEVQRIHGHGQAYQQVQLYHHEVLGRPKVQIQHIRCRYLLLSNLFLFVLLFLTLKKLAYLLDCQN